MPVCPIEYHTATFLGRLLDVIDEEIVPKTNAALQAGNKLFGAAIIRKADLSLVVADTNKEMEWPLLHGEVSCLRTLNSLPPSEQPAARDCFFIATHEPCSLCLSAITWTGFDNFYYLFSYTDTKDAFSIPHDLKILKEVFKCDHGAYEKSNAYWTAHDIVQLIDVLPLPAERDLLQARVEGLRERYNGMSVVYQSSKKDNKIPLN